MAAETGLIRTASPRTVEFFAGFGLVRLALDDLGIETVWANDVDAEKGEAYTENFGDGEFQLGDVRDVAGESVPDCDLATASFPCVDLSLAGRRRGLGRTAAPRADRWESSMFWEFTRVLGEMASRRPSVVMCENVLGFATSHGGRDLREAIVALNELGYSCDVVALDARSFVPQSRPRVFVVGVLEPPATEPPFTPSEVRPTWAVRCFERNTDLRLHAQPLPPLPIGPNTLAGYVEDFPPEAAEWWHGERFERFVQSLAPIQRHRLETLRGSEGKTWRTAYRRTRQGRAVWEMRADGIAGCLRTARGGSSKQALVEAGDGAVRVRWMTPREYAMLMGASDYRLPPRRNQAFFGFGDAVCAPVIRWLGEQYLLPLLRRNQAVLLEAA